MVERIVCNHCKNRDVEGGCNGCLAGIAYEVAEERERRIRAKEGRAITKRHSKLKLYKSIGRAGR